MTADLNYSLKRLVGGLISDNHQVKQGFFLATVMIINRFKSFIDFEKFINYVKEETKCNSGMKNPEIHCMQMARMLCVSAIIESGWVSTASGNQTMLERLINILANIYVQHEFLREAIQITLTKIFNQPGRSVKIFDYTVETFKLNTLHSVKDQSSSDWSMYFSMRSSYQTNFQGKSEKHNDFMNEDIFQNQKTMRTMQTLVKQQTYLYPRLHSASTHLISQLLLDQKNFEKNFQAFNQSILVEGIFNEAIYDTMKSHAKLKYLHIGLKMAETILRGCLK